MLNPKKYISKPYIKFRKLFRGKVKPPGTPPGTLVYTGDKKREHVTINLIEYNQATITEKVITDPNECKTCINPGSISWIDIEGLHDIDIIRQIGESLNLHPLVMEDIVHVDQRPKMEDYEDYVYVVLKMFHMHENTNEITAEQVSIIFGKNYVVTFQEGFEGDTFQEIRSRIKGNKGLINKMSSDYLVYSLIDSIIDSYFSMLELLSDKIENLEEELINNPIKSTLNEIYSLKREMLFLKKTVWPLREAISKLERGESSLVTKSTHFYLRDVYDHTFNVLETIENYRDILSGMIEIYLSSLNNKLNETMKYLALISTIFIPMTFIASIYGMNFDFMPELKWINGYYFALGLMLTVGLGFLIYFKKKKWV